MTETVPDWRRNLERRISAAGFSPRRLSIAAGLSPTAVRDILKGRSNRPRFKTLYRIGEILGASPEELMDPESFIASTNAKTPEALTGPSEPDFEVALWRIPLLESGAITGEKPLGSIFTEEIALPRTFVQNLGASKPVFISAPDEAMAPTIHLGDLLLVDRALTRPRRDGIYVLSRPGQIMIRRLRLNPVRDTVTVLADASGYAAIEDVPISDLHLFGLVVWQGRAL